jgi:hypothetical protein
LKINPDEISVIQDALDGIDKWDLELFNVWESAKGELKITIRLGREGQ